MLSRILWVRHPFYAAVFAIIAASNCYSQAITFDDSGLDSILITSEGQYQIRLDKNNGAILYIREASSGTDVVVGMAGNDLWVLNPVGWPYVPSSKYSPTGPDLFSYVWENPSNTLSMQYRSQPGDALEVDATVTWQFSTNGFFDIQLEFTNKTGLKIREVLFPGLMELEMGPTDYAILPESYPGMLLGPEFFSQRESIEIGYPQTAMADYMGVHTKGIPISFYALFEDRDSEVAQFGFQGAPAPDPNRVWHSYFVYVENGNSWSSPVLRFRVNLPFFDSIMAFRADNGIDGFPSLRDKLGSRFDRIAQSPILNYSMVQRESRSFSAVADWAKHYRDPAIIMLTAFQKGGYLGGHPDYNPPSIQFGSANSMREMVATLQDNSLLVMPFINLIWWHEDSPTVQNTADISDFAQMKRRDTPNYFAWSVTPGIEEWGYFVSPHSPMAQARIEQVFTDIYDYYGCDMVFEDGVGAFVPYYDFNRHAPSPTVFAKGWLEHTKQYKDRLLVPEGGSDRMAEYAVGFMGSVRSNSGAVKSEQWNYDTGTGSRRPYPVSAILYHDKILPYEFWENAADSPESITWSLTYGSPLINQIDVASDLMPHSVTIRRLTDFQHKVLSRFAGKKMTEYEELSSSVIRSRFEDIEVVSNWHSTSEHDIGEHTIPAKGALVTSVDGKLTAGFFTKFNGLALTAGVHALIVVESEGVIEVYHPSGEATKVRISRPDEWTSASNIHVYAKTSNSLDDIGRTLSATSIEFDVPKPDDYQEAPSFLITYGTTGLAKEDLIDTPLEFRLKQNYPNPFNPSTTIAYSLPRASDIELAVFNLLGKRVRVLEKGFKSRGEYEFTFQATGLGSGMYFYTLTAGDVSQSRKMVVLK